MGNDTATDGGGALRLPATDQAEAFEAGYRAAVDAVTADDHEHGTIEALGRLAGRMRGGDEMRIAVASAWLRWTS